MCHADLYHREPEEVQGVPDGREKGPRTTRKTTRRTSLTSGIACIALLVGMAQTQEVAASFATVRISAESVESDARTKVWDALHGYEKRAIRDYDQHRFGKDVRERGEQLWELSRTREFQDVGANCTKAAETLSYMVIGYYDAARRLSIALDWHYYAKPYRQHRAACLSDLGIDAKRYSLPRWFGS